MTNTVTHIRNPFALARLTRDKAMFLCAVLFLAGASLTPQSAFSIDDILYIDMAEATAERGALDVTHQNAPDGAPVMTKSTGIVHVIDGKAIPQYPGGYGLIAAPFFMLFGVSGLVVLNALAGALSLWLTYEIARRLSGDAAVARNACLLLGFTTIFAGYVFAIWPHMLALAFTLGGARLTLTMPEMTGRRRLYAALAAGLIFGLGVNVRVDAIVPAFAAFFWLRLFSLPSDRRSALALLAGLLPGLLIAAAINQQKFGVFLPFFYGQEQGGHTMTAYAPLAMAGLGAIAASFVVNVSAPAIQRELKHALNAKAALAIGMLAVAAFAFNASVRDLARSVYFLVVDLQAFDGGNGQAGVERDVYGNWSFWGLPKKALLQSLPFAALAVFPVAAFFRGKDAGAHAFSLLMISAILGFFSLKGFHGGMAFNMRYFLPAIPFIAILSAQAFQNLTAICKPSLRMLAYAVAFGALAGILFYQTADAAPVRFRTLLQLYPQLVLCALLFLTCIFVLMRPNNGRGALAALLLSGAAFGYAGVVSLSDAVGYWSIRAAKAPHERALAAMIPPGSLVLTMGEDYLVRASLDGAHVARPKSAAEAAEAIAAYEKAGRCVYVHTQAALAFVDANGFERIAGAPGDFEQSMRALYAPADRPARCQRS